MERTRREEKRELFNIAIEEKNKNSRGDWKETCPQGALFVLAAKLNRVRIREKHK